MLPQCWGRGGAGGIMCCSHMKLPSVILGEETYLGLSLSDNTTTGKDGDAEAGV